jgi:Tfp pilus assembly protein PilN
MTAILNTVFLGNTFSAFELFSKAGKTCISYIKVKKAGSSLEIDTLEFYNDANEFKYADLKEPVVLIVNTDQILIKEVEIQDLNEKKILFKAFPNVKADEFYYEIWPLKQRAIVAVVRKEYINKLLLLYPKIKFSGIFLGINAVSNLNDFNLPDTFFTNTHSVTLNNVSVLSSQFTYRTESYMVNGIEVQSQYLNAFTAILRVFMPKSTLGSLNELDSSIHENFKQESFFRKVLSISIIGLFVLLVINFGFFNYYFNKVQEGQAISQEKVSENAAINRLQQQTKEKEKQLRNFQYNRNRPFAFIVNKIAQDVPGSILLEELTVNPLKKKFKVEEPITVEDSKIEVKGNALSTDAFTEWMKKLQAYPLVQRTKIMAYDGENGQGHNFVISIHLKDEAQQKK